MKINVFGMFAAILVATANCAWGHGFGLSLESDSQGNAVVIAPASESTILDGNGNAIGPQNLFVSAFSGTASSDGSYGVIHGFAYATGAWPSYTATYNILSPLFFSDGTGTGPTATVPASSGTYMAVYDRDVGLYPGAAPGTVQFTGGIAGVGPFVPGYGVSLFDPHELQKKLYFGAASTQYYGEYGFSYEVSVTLAGGQKLTTGPLIDVFATDIGTSGFYSNAPILQQNAATMAIYSAAIAVPESWNYNGSGSYSDGTKWYQTIPNGLGFTAAFGGGATTAVNGPMASVTIDRAVYAGTLIFDNATTSYTLAADGVDGHGIVLNNNGVGAAVNVNSGNHMISANLTLADMEGTVFTIAPGSTLTISGAFATSGANPTVALNGSGTLRITSPPTFVANTSIQVNGGKLKFSAASGSATIGNGVTLTVASGATLELAGSISALSSAVNIANNSTQASGGGLIVSGTNQQAGNINGAGDLVINAGGNLTASQVMQNSIVIGGTASAPAMLTISASDTGAANLILAGSLSPRGPFAAGSEDSVLVLSDQRNADDVSSGSSPVISLDKIVSDDSTNVPEPSTLLLASLAPIVASAFRGLTGGRRKARGDARAAP
ncbi:MAG TPA: hypothetical protein VGY55_05735 [Pirellulales bacterium]|jgi:hypothetical protein|nr:hypothetical protein [Pirellulales bacterium]